MILPSDKTEFNSYFNLHNEGKTETIHLGKVRFSIEVKGKTKKKGIFKQILEFLENYKRKL